MSEYVLHSTGGLSGRRLHWFLAAEAVCLVGAGVAVWLFDARLSLVFLIAPFQLAVLALCFKSDTRLLAYFVAVLPLTALELIPYSFMSFVMYGVVLGLIVFLRATTFIDAHRESSANRATAWHRTALVLLGVCVGLALLNAYAHGRQSHFVVSYSVLAVQVLLLVWLAVDVPRSIGELRQIVYVVLTSYAVMCLAFPLVATQVGLGSVGKGFIVGHSSVNLNAVGAHAAAFTLVALGAALDARRNVTRALLFVAALLLVVVLVYTKSRGAWLGFGLAFVYVIARTRSFWLILPTAAVLVLLLSLDVLHGALASRVEATSTGDPSLLGRLLLWRYAWVVFKDNWLLGVGLENFRFVKQFYGWPEPTWYAVRFNSHNLFLELLADLGIVGSVCFWWLFGGAFARVDRIVRRPTCVGRNWLAVGLGAALISFAGHGLFDCIIWQHGAFMALGLLIGMCLCLERLESSQPAIPSQRFRPEGADNAETLS
ncbi:O-antigen ligase family protein [candidate division WOR-3 bacterium]|uniref:O-antigen ligase family protein n=1 Tax=candidate division WOR-3 bacterium TaxID=2052148 RepID=A0A937XE68_UNCW3|nr:O-antigen ligase family protein [candidate division WOR-3 bacterium]